MMATHLLSRGQAALATIFLIGGIIVLFSISIALITLSFANSTLGFQAANKALAVATGGIRDAEVRLLRNKDFSNTSGYCVPASNPPCPSGSATVTVTQGNPAAGEVTVTSDATISIRRRKLQGIYAVSTTTSQLTNISLQELTF